MPKTVNRSRSALMTYARESRELGTSLLLVLPLFVLYQLGILLTGGLRNGVDFVTSSLVWATGHDVWAYIALNLVIAIAGLGAILALRRRGALHPRWWPLITAESSVYAFFFGSVVLWLMSAFGLEPALQSGPPAMGLIDKLVMSVGAGLYEEIVFRLIGVGGAIWALARLAPRTPRLARAALAVLISSLIFSGIHHLGALGEPFTFDAFTYRFFAGLVLAAIFWARGFAVAVYTHAIYDVIVMVFR